MADANSTAIADVTRISLSKLAGNALHIAASNTSTVPAADKLTPTEVYLVHLFRQTNDRTQARTVVVLEKSVESPLLRRTPAEPTLKVIAGGAQ